MPPWIDSNDCQELCFSDVKDASLNGKGCPKLIAGSKYEGRCDMKITRFKRAFLWLLMFTMILSNCSPKSTPPGPDSAFGKFEQTAYSFHRWEEGLVLMIWHDVSESSMCEGSGSTTDPVYRLQCYAESKDGRRVDWEVQTADGRTAQFRIDDISYDLSDGALFIIKTRDGETRVIQLQRDLSSVHPNRESVTTFARSDPDVLSFIESIATE